MSDIYKILTKTSELVNDSGFLTTLAHNSTTSLDTGNYQHLTQSEHDELTQWLDDVTLGADGALTLPTGVSLTITDKIRLNAISGKLGFYNTNAGNWNVVLYTGVANTLNTDQNFTAGGALTAVGACQGVSLITTGGTVTGANSTSIDIGATVAGKLYTKSSTGVVAGLALQSGTSAVLFTSYTDSGTQNGADLNTLLRFVQGGGTDITCFDNSAEGTAKSFQIWGYPTSAGARLFGRGEIARISDVNYFKLSTSAAGGFNFDDDNITTTGNVVAGASSTFGGNAVATVATKLDDFGATDDNTDLDATTSKHGLMPKADKVKLDGIETAATSRGYALTIAPNAETIWTDSEIQYFAGIGGVAPSTTEALHKMLIPKTGTIKAAVFYTYGSGTAGSAEAWAWYIRLNATSDTLIASVESDQAIRTWANYSLNISVTQGDLIAIKVVNPAWATNPGTTYILGSVYIE